MNEDRQTSAGRGPALARRPHGRRTVARGDARARAGRGALRGRDHAGDGRADRSRPIANDPIARQFVPQADELVATPRRERPIRSATTRIRRSRASCIAIPTACCFKLVHACAVYCRFCFRREMVGPGGASALSATRYRGALDYIASHPEIWEVILTGGDPLILSPRRLAEIMDDLARNHHVKIVRFHTRVPVVDPDAHHATMVDALRRPRRHHMDRAACQSSARIHAAGARRRCARLADAGIPLVSQSVLLRGVNDDAATLEALMRAFVECRIKPYYLHHGDLAPGTAHLRTTHRGGAGAGGDAARTGVGPLPARLCARYSRRIWQGSGRPGLC